jgi:hypothetical protein
MYESSETSTYSDPAVRAAIRETIGNTGNMYPNGIPEVKVGFLRTEPGAALASLTSMKGFVRNATVHKQGETLVLWDESLNFAVKATTFDKLAKLWAKEYGMWADSIDVAKSF